MEYYSVSLTKPNEGGPCEDASYAGEGCVAVSDGAGGCGIFADEWAQYLISKLPKTEPIATFAQFDQWVDSIYEAFYDVHEQQARATDPSMLLSKFYSEGSCATLAAAWVQPDGVRWMAYGDSVVFSYHPQSGRLEYSPIRLAQFSQPPHLVSCSEPLEEEAFHSGVFQKDEEALVFAASDALSHYIIMMYQLAHPADNAEELEEERRSGTINAQLLQVAENLPSIDFDACLRQLMEKARERGTFCQLTGQLYADRLLDSDDYSLAVATKERPE